ncbi:MAG: Phage SPO1 DNA polymerase-related protein [Limisphaerales bacterium]|nr:MAG: Phage SPO1 DNA polymerase-related protein [Limisphaerales bacterium]KAG0506730.1 MAG: Phage SPO1 DNA polymerase-related protein [Limisphaerales bacterium]TXT51714.1 MAG: Phage SPO1 DNA polymerase-related protein [Limisphaerales bacterium]
MSAYAQLLDAAIRDLEERKAAGERFVAVAPATLGALAAPLSAPTPTRAKPVESSAPAARPAPAPRAGGLQPPSATPARAPLFPAVQPTRTSVAAPPPLPALNISAAGKPAAFAALRERALACTKCPHLVTTRKSVVFGVGDPNAQLMFVGEAPGADEDQQGEPFVGRAGQLLTRIIQATGLTRDKVYIANVLKCRPDTPGQSYGNRKPRADEMATCLPYLLEQIQLIQPRVIVALGGTAVEGLFGQTEVRITRLRGSWMSFHGTPVMPTFHPSYVLRAEDGPDKGRATKRQVWEDMLQVMERLQMPISEKQRGFFK